MSDERDTTPALGTPGAPASWRREREGASVALHVGRWEDGRWSYLYGGQDTEYRSSPPDPQAVAAAARRARNGPLGDVVQGPVMQAPVWTWEVPLYFWFGGVAAGASFAALACDLAGDRRSAVIARRVALGAALPAPPLLIADLGRPARFLNMLRVFKPRSPMSMGAWCLSAFSLVGAGAVALDLLGRRRAAALAGAGNAAIGVYLGSYAGALLSATAVPVWAGSRVLLAPLFVASATGTGAAATRLALAAGGQGDRHPTQRALARVQTGAMVTELALSALNARRLGPLGDALHRGRPGRLLRAAAWSARAGLALGLARPPAAQHASSALFLAGGLALRYGWVAAGTASAGDDRAVAAHARGSCA